MAIQFLLFSFLVLLFNNGASSYISSEDLSNSLAEAPSYNNHPNSDEQNIFSVDDYGAKANGSDDSEPCRDAPTALYFYHCRHLKVRNITSKDSQQMHIVFSHCHNVEAVHLTIRAPDWSPNTDGIHLSSTRNMRISNCFIGTGDDCISIVNGSRNVHVDNIVCGPGHGISIGSLGSNNSRAHVSKVHVEKATLIGTDNGVRIKTWQGGHGHAKNIHFEDISMCNVYNPIIINQNYCDSKIPCYQQDSAVAVREVVYKNIRGTSASDISINFNCSSTVPCKYIKLQDISLVSPDSFTSRSSCINVINSTESGSVFPSCNA
ncbi:Pectin lyase-like superfamily protein [Rhynchospora pubera]|uniref:Pectin lyase-like superfamily protein n=1 Tax=Rhynchospora pubera TaxID=906938 RepID=A0AAV8DHB1_9POAL|nr:Pectin lyase-like superfamily protein [Rhynchospora pubera]